MGHIHYISHYEYDWVWSTLHNIFNFILIIYEYLVYNFSVVLLARSFQEFLFWKLQLDLLASEGNTPQGPLHPLVPPHEQGAAASPAPVHLYHQLFQRYPTSAQQHSPKQWYYKLVQYCVVCNYYETGTRVEWCCVFIILYKNYDSHSLLIYYFK